MPSEKDPINEPKDPIREETYTEAANAALDDLLPDVPESKSGSESDEKSPGQKEVRSLGNNAIKKTK